jgi:hypothetical protein
VRVILASLEPQPVGLPVMHALAPMGEEPGTSLVTIASGAKPMRFFDILVQARHLFITSSSADATPRRMLAAVGSPSATERI